MDLLSERAENVGFGNDVVLLVIDGHFVVSVFREHDLVADFVAERKHVAFVGPLAFADSDDDAALRFLFVSRVGNDDAGRLLFIP